MAAQKKFTLGRGLDALISTEEVKTSGSSSINEIELSKIAQKTSMLMMRSSLRSVIWDTLSVLLFQNLRLKVVVELVSRAAQREITISSSISIPRQCTIP